MKKFLLVTSQLPEDRLSKYVYTPADNPDLTYGETRFPAIPMINASIENGESIKVITVTYDTPHCHHNLQLLECEIAKVCKEKNCSFELESLEVPFDDSINAILHTYMQLISRIEDGDELFADITYGSKPMPIVLTMVLQYAYRVKSNVTIECVTYGQIGHHQEKATAKIFDVTALVQIDEIVRLMADGNVSDPANVLNKIIRE